MRQSWSLREALREKAVVLALGFAMVLLDSGQVFAQAGLSEAVKIKLMDRVLTLVGGETRGITGIVIEETGPAEWPQIHYVRLWAEHANGLRSPGLVYVSPDGAYLFSGNLFDGHTLDNLTKARQGNLLPRYDVGRINLSQAHRQGPVDAAVTVVEFGDYQCPFCTRLQPVMERLLHEYSGKIVHYFKHAPLAHVHPLAHRLHEAAECAARQKEDVFWVFHKRLFSTKTTDWEPATIRQTTVSWAREAGLDEPTFANCVDSGLTAPVVAKNLAESPLNATPVLIIDGEVVEGFWPYEQLQALIERKLRSRQVVDGLTPAGPPAR